MNSNEEEEKGGIDRINIVEDHRISRGAVAWERVAVWRSTLTAISLSPLNVGQTEILVYMYI